MREYYVKNSDGNMSIMHYIGANYIGDGLVIKDVISSYNKDFDNKDEFIIDPVSKRYCTIGNTMEAYKYLRSEVASKRPIDLYEYAECVYKVVLRYFGNMYYAKNRLSYFPSEKEIAQGKEQGKISDLAHKNAAMSLERAILVQNLFVGDLGFKSIFKISEAIINDKKTIHAYNLLYHDDKYYLVDVTIPSIINNRINPIICEIPKEVYDKISSPLNDIGCSITVNHMNPLENKKYSITYDAARDEEYQIAEKFIKKKVLDE